MFGAGMTIVSSDQFGLRASGFVNVRGVRVINRSGLNGARACQFTGAATPGQQSVLSSAECSATGSGAGNIAIEAVSTKSGQVFYILGVTATATAPPSGGGSAPRGILFSTDPVASGPGTTSTMTVELSVLLAQGGLDFDTTNDSASRRACIEFRYTASRTGASGQCTPVETEGRRDVPAFVDFATDRHLVIGSSLIDTFAGPVSGGASASIPPEDIDGLPRDLQNPDPGAYERRAVIAQTTAATGVSQTGATLNGNVRGAYGVASVRYEYGPTTAYGTQTAARAVRATAGAEPFTPEAITGLTPGTTYHARIVLTDADGRTVPGADVAFTTGGTPPGGGTTTSPTPTTPTTTTPATATPGQTVTPTQVATPPATTPVRRCKVPNLRNRTFTAAKALLRRAGCRVGTIRRARLRGPYVRSQTVAAGRTLSENARVGVTLGRKVRGGRSS